MVLGLERNSPRRRRLGSRLRSRSPSSFSPSSSRTPSPDTSPTNYNSRNKTGDDKLGIPDALPRPYMKQVKLHPSGCQQWSNQVVTGGGIYMAYASTLTTYIYDTRDYSLVSILGGNDCNVHSILWHPQNRNRLLVLSTDGRGSLWDVPSEERVSHYNVCASPECSAWDPLDPSNLAVVAKGTNITHLLRKDDSGRGGFSKGFTRSSANESLAATCAKWSQHQPGVLVVGWTDGRVSFAVAPSSKRGKEKAKVVFPDERGGSVVDLRHDPHGGAYLLVAYRSGSVILWDAAGHGAISAFDRCAVGLAGVRWMAWAPGNFLALSSKSGVAKVFNISQKNAIGTVRLGETGSGIKDMAWLPSRETPSASLRIAMLSLLPQLSSPASTGPRAICGFRDGSLTVVDTAFGGKNVPKTKFSGGRSGGGGSSASMPWASKAGHTETVFSCAHRPGDADTMATGSYGSSVKVWHVPTMDLKVTLTGQTGAIYSVAWSTDGERIASTSGEGTVWIWDAESGKAEHRLRLHSRAAHRVEWDPFNGTRLASASADRSLIIFSEHGAVERVYTHPSGLFGCSWCPGHPNVIATGCQDGNVRVFDASWSAGLEPQYVLSGHTQRVFHVAWSPLLDGTLASGSDDGSVMVWDLGGGTLPRSNPAGGQRTVRPSAVLRGHTSNVRPLHWNSEIPWLLLSGSWDGTVRAWDIRRAGVGDQRHHDTRSLVGGVERSAGHQEKLRGGDDACIAVMSDHVADVYGLSSAPERPFLYASASRDTTLRQFTLEGVVSSIKTKAVIGNTLASMLGNTSDAMRRDSPTVLCGSASRILENQLREIRRSHGSSSIEAARKTFDFFWSSDGIDTFWETLRWVTSAATRSPKIGMSEQAARISLSHKCRPSLGNGFEAGKEEGGRLDDIEPTLSLRDVPQGLMVVEERVIHRDARRASDRALADLLTKAPAFIVQDRRLSRFDRVERASRLHLATGDLQSACESLVSLGKWERALALAPGVGTGYWRRLAAQYIEGLLAGGVETDGSGGGQCGADTISMAASLLVSTGRPLEAIDALKGSDEALTLAAAVADGAYPPPLSTLPKYGMEKMSPSVAVASVPQCGAVANGIRREAAGERVAGSSDNTGLGGEQKLLGLIDAHLAEAEAKREGNRSRNGNGTLAESDDEGKSSTKQDNVGSGETCRTDDGRRRSTSPEPMHDNVFDHRQERRDGRASSSGSSSAPSPSQKAGVHEQAAACAVQREAGDAILRSMTDSRAAIFFRASQPVLAAASLLSVCDGSRLAAAPALSLLIRGEESELAYAAARVLRFPARELRPLVREMARRAEAWGDPGLSVELLLDAGGEDSVGVAGCADSNRCRDSRGAQGDETDTPPIDGGYWAADVYGTCGEEAGPRGAALVMSRSGAAGASGSYGSNASPKLTSFRSKASYLEDAAAAVSHGMDAEAVRLLVLGGDLKQAAELGVRFLRDILSASSVPSRSLKDSLAVTRSLGSGSGSSSLASHHVPTDLRNEVLAYASFVGALEATARNYHSVVTPLLRNTSVCVQAVERLAGCVGDRCRGDSQVEADEEKRGSGDLEAAESFIRGRSPGGGRYGNGVVRSSGVACRRRSSPSRYGNFPPCMSTGVLALAAMQYLTTKPSATNRGGGAKGEASEIAERHRRYTPQVGLETDRRIRDEKDLSIDEAKYADDLLSRAERGPMNDVTDRTVRRGGNSAPVLVGVTSTNSTSMAGSWDEKTNSREDIDNNYGGEPLSPTSASPMVIGAAKVGWPGTLLTSGATRSPPPVWHGACGEIIVGGSRLPSCRRHGRAPSRMYDSKTIIGTHTWGSLACALNLETSTPEFGQPTWARTTGATFLLEDGETAMGLNDAVMWTKVNPFSPLNTGSRLMPY